MSFALRTLIPLLALLFAPMLARAIDDAPFEDPVLNERYFSLISEVRCLVCQNQSIADSNAGLAADLRREIRAMIASGKSDREITQFLTARYGDFVMYRPPLKPVTWALWAGPGVLLVLGAFVYWRILRVRQAQFEGRGAGQP